MSNHKYNKEYYKNHKEKINKQATQWRKNNPEKVKQINIKSNYGLSHEDWLKMWENQNGKCAICGKLFSTPSNIYVDHNHRTGEVRGLLCQKCNYGIGYLNDDLQLIRRAIKYLKERG